MNGVYMLSTLSRASRNLFYVGAHKGDLQSLLVSPLEYMIEPKIYLYAHSTHPDAVLKCVHGELGRFKVTGNWFKCGFETLSGSICNNLNAVNVEIDRFAKQYLNLGNPRADSLTAQWVDENPPTYWEVEAYYVHYYTTMGSDCPTVCFDDFVRILSVKGFIVVNSVII